MSSSNRGGQSDSTPSRQQTDRSGGASACQGFGLIGAAMAGLGLLLCWAGYVVLDAGQSVAPYAGGASSSLLLGGVVIAGTGVAHLAAAYGLWKRTSWGRQVALTVAGVGFIGGLLTATVAGAVGVTGLALYGSMAWYLYTNGEGYERQRPGSPTRGS